MALARSAIVAVAHLGVEHEQRKTALLLENLLSYDLDFAGRGGAEPDLGFAIFDQRDVARIADAVEVGGSLGN